MSNGIGFMTRGLGQVLFNYLPDATFDYDKGSCICKVSEVLIDTSIEERIDRNRLLAEIRVYVSRWEERTSIRLEDTHKAGLFAFGTPEKIYFNVYPLTFECRNCRSAFSYNKEEEFLSDPRNYKCRWCSGRLGQIYHVLVHQCGNLKSLWVPRCQNHGNKPSRVKLDFQGSQKARDFRWLCMDCNQELRHISRTCDECAKNQADNDEEKGAERAKPQYMRPIPHRANAAYYTHHITRINIGTQDLVGFESHPDKERILVDAHLQDSYDIKHIMEGTPTGNLKQNKAEELRRIAMGLPEGPDRQKLLDAAETIEGISEIRSDENSRAAQHQIAEDALRELFEYVRLRSTCKTTGTKEVRETHDRRRPGMGAIFDLIDQEYSSAGIAEIKLLSDFPILTAVFGYTRIGFEPETNMGNETVKTVFNWFPTLRMNKEALVDKIPIFVRDSETEAILVRINPTNLLNWLERAIPGSLGTSLTSEGAARLWLLRNVGEIDRFVSPKKMSQTTKAVFGLLHTLSHIFIRAAASLAGIDRTGLSEYLFPRIGAFVIYNSNAIFNLGGLTTMFEENLEELLANARFTPLVRNCVYDPICSEKWNSSCHACTHLGEMACSYFNRCMSRDYLFGPDGLWPK